MSRGNAVRTVVSAVSVLALAFAGAVVLAGPASAAALTATDSASLKAAIDTANLDTAPDVITVSGTITLAENLPTITHDLEIVGAPGSTIDGANAYTAFSINGGASNINVTFTNVAVSNTSLGITSAAGNVTIVNSTFDNAPVHILGTGVTVQVKKGHFKNSSTSDGFFSSVDGSSTIAIDQSTATGNHEDGFDVSLTGGSGYTVTGSTATSNGHSGFYASAALASTVNISTSYADTNSEGFTFETQTAGKVAIATSTATSNTGNGFASESDDAGDDVSFTTCTATSNGDTGFSSVLHGGTVTGSHLTASKNQTNGLYLFVRAGGTATYSDSQFSETVRGYNVSIDPDGGSSTATLERVTVTKSAMLVGGGIHIDDGGYVGAHSSVNVLDSTIAHNVGSGMDIVTITSTDVVVQNSTISGNEQLGGAGIYATLNGTSTLSLLNSTISGNSCGGGCGIYSSGANTAKLIIANSTIVDNHGTWVGYSGGIEVDGTTFDIHNSIIAGNLINATRMDFLFDAGAPSTGTVTYSLVQASDVNAAVSINAGTGNLKNMDAKLGLLANNGGPTLTHLPLDGSPVIDAGDHSTVGAPAKDQRGLTRVVGVIDMGAVELQPALAATGVDVTAPFTGGAIVLGLGVLLLTTRRRRTALSA